MPFNPEHFRRRYPGRPLPDIRFRPERRRWGTGRRLARHFGQPGDGSDASPVWELFDRSVPLGIPSPSPLDLTPLFDEYGIPTRSRVYLDWYSGDGAEVDLPELLGSFPGLWEPGDDLALFDDSCEWVLYFTRGEVRLARPAGGDGA
jgi:hypothetical protein